jgi:hypothetical protein
VEQDRGCARLGDGRVGAAMANATVGNAYRDKRGSQDEGTDRGRDASVCIPFLVGAGRMVYPNLRQSFLRARSQCEMTTSPAANNGHKTARKALYTVCY